MKALPLIKIIIFSIILLGSAWNNLHSQGLIIDVHGTSGGQLVSNDGIVSWTLGEAVVGEISSPSGIVTQGFNQGYLNGDFIISTSIETTGADYSFTAYPNPTQDWILIEFDGNLSYQQIEILDMTGRIVESVDSAISPVTIDLSYLFHGVYHIRILDKSKNQLHYFKLVKL